MKRINPIVKNITNLFRPGDFKYREVLKLYGNIAISKTLFQHCEDGSEKEIATIDYAAIDPVDCFESASLYSDIDSRINISPNSNTVEIFDGHREDDSLGCDFYLHKIGDIGDKFHILNSYYDVNKNNRVYRTEECWYEDETLLCEELSYRYDCSGRIVEVIDTRVETECTEEEYLDTIEYDIFRYDQDFIRAEYRYMFKYDEIGRVIESSVIMASDLGATITLISKYSYDESVSLKEEFSKNSTVVVFPTVICKDIATGEFVISDDILGVQSINGNPHISIDGYVESATDGEDCEIEIVRYIRTRMHNEGHKVCSLYDDDLNLYWVHLDEYKNPSLL